MLQAEGMAELMDENAEHQVAVTRPLAHFRREGHHCLEDRNKRTIGIRSQCRCSGTEQPRWQIVKHDRNGWRRRLRRSRLNQTAKAQPDI